MRRLINIEDVDGNRELALEQDAYRLGRAKDNDIVLGVRTVSAHHAALVLRDDEYWIEDLLSTNGTYVNGRRIQRRRLRDRDRVQLADCRIHYFEIAEPRGVKTRVYSEAMLKEAMATAARDPWANPRERRENNQMRNRRGESGAVPFRSGRFFTVGDKWYFATREGEDVGPFDELHQARAALVEYGRKIGFSGGQDADHYWR